MPLEGFRLSFVGEDVVINSVAEVFAVEGVGTWENLAVFGVCVIILDVENHFAYPKLISNGAISNFCKSLL